MATVASFEMALALHKHGIMTAVHKHYSVSELRAFFSLPAAGQSAWYTMGTSEVEFKKFQRVQNALSTPIQRICVDVANGYRQCFLESINDIRQKLPTTTIMAGNVATPEQARDLICAGADLVKCGLGSGGGCLTRLKTGVGYPQLSAVMECAEAVYEVDGILCADGGCQYPGDIAKAFGAGAHMVMVGSMLAGHDEVSAHRSTDKDGNIFIDFYGESSKKAMDKHHNGMSSYRTSEGRHVKIPARGPVNDTILDILGGLRSTMTYVGASKISDLDEKVSFVKVNQTHNQIYSNLG